MTKVTEEMLIAARDVFREKAGIAIYLPGEGTLDDFEQARADGLKAMAETILALSALTPESGAGTHSPVDHVELIAKLRTLTSNTGRDHRTGEEFVHGAGSQEVVDALRSALAALQGIPPVQHVTVTGLRYRPNEFDDWGQIRNADGSMFASVRRPASEEELAEHRRNGTDPYEDLARRLMASFEPKSKLPIELDGVAEQLSETYGMWRSCTGCHELNEGVPLGTYSNILKCHLGIGCYECGGIGAIWDRTDYAAMGEYIAADAEHPPVQHVRVNTPGAVEAFRAIDVADRLIQAAYGDDVPKEWNKAWKSVAKARAAASEADHG